MSKIDLNVHTNASDGEHTPQEIVELAAEHNVSLLAIADHDTIAAYAPAVEAARKYPTLRVIPAIELSSHAPGSEVHILANTSSSAAALRSRVN